VKALADNNGNQTRAAVALGMSRRALVNRIEQYGLPRPRKR
jgi:DNA-binding protein Fis